MTMKKKIQIVKSIMLKMLQKSVVKQFLIGLVLPIYWLNSKINRMLIQIRFSLILIEHAI